MEPHRYNRPGKRPRDHDRGDFRHMDFDERYPEHNKNCNIIFFNLYLFSDFS